MIRAYETLDCASKVRVHYLLPVAVTPELLARIPDAQVSVQEFSKLAKGAKDHFTLLREGRVRAAGVLGENRLVVTYGKLLEQRPVEEIATFEAQLVECGLGPIEYFQRPASWPVENS